MVWGHLVSPKAGVSKLIVRLVSLGVTRGLGHLVLPKTGVSKFIVRTNGASPLNEIPLSPNHTHFTFFVMRY